MNIVVFDTETTSLTKPFCYNIGYIIGNENGEILLKRDYVVEQVWHNLPLFSSAYYAEKRPLYIERMRARKVVMDKFGYICRQMSRDFQQNEVAAAYAYNSSFDDKVFEFNCDWFKVNNPFEQIPIFDIRGNVHEFIVNDWFCDWCEKNNEFTESGNYSTTAETVYRFLSDKTDFTEEHTALADSEIEFDILLATVRMGAVIGKKYGTRNSIERNVEKELTVIATDKKEYRFTYNKMRMNKTKTEIILK
jgi:hypothetical protein